MAVKTISFFDVTLTSQLATTIYNMKVLFLKSGDMATTYEIDLKKLEKYIIDNQSSVASSGIAQALAAVLGKLESEEIIRKV